MAAIGIDTHKRTLAACAVDEVGGVIDERTFDCDPAGFVELAAWAGGVAPEVRIGIEARPHTARPWPTISSRPGSAHTLIGEGSAGRLLPPMTSDSDDRSHGTVETFGLPVSVVSSSAKHWP
jgi:hypothetical protein